MSISERLVSFLKENKISYEVIAHPEAFTAQQVAHAIHQSGKVLAKTVVVTADGKQVMVVVPAHHRVLLDAVKKITSAKEVHIAPEETLRKLFPDCDLGAMPPLGTMYGMEVIVSRALQENADIIFNGCTHTDCVKMQYGDFIRVVEPKVEDVSHIPPEAR
ncbi:MAG: YbaK/EbsC family protein [Ignavibacteria bacterium]|nr:YbaK/EbsC family protein [Ignavibacteria bacterium]